MIKYFCSVFQILFLSQGLADAGGDGGNSRKEQKTPNLSHNGLLPSQPLPKRSRTTTPTPANKMPRIEPLPITRVVSPPSNDDEDAGIVEVDPGDNPNVKSENWPGEDSSEYEIATDQFEQDMQAEDEQYIQAGNDALSGQQVNTLPFFLVQHNTQPTEKTEYAMVKQQQKYFTISL